MLSFLTIRFICHHVVKNARVSCHRLPHMHTCDRIVSARMGLKSPGWDSARMGLKSPGWNIARHWPARLARPLVHDELCVCSTAAPPQVSRICPRGRFDR